MVIPRGRRLEGVRNAKEKANVKGERQTAYDGEEWVSPFKRN
jgi:hypothetical protein